MTDRELLVLAAKAAGYWRMEYRDDVPYVSASYSPLDDWTPWNPLISHGDVFRLAVKLNIDLMFTTRMGDYAPSCSVIFPLADDFEPLSEPSGDDPYAAMCRAIVRAAAAIGGQQ